MNIATITIPQDTSVEKLIDLLNRLEIVFSFPDTDVVKMPDGTDKPNGIKNIVTDMPELFRVEKVPLPDEAPQGAPTTEKF